jgi:phosphoserine aminotransferase
MKPDKKPKNPCFSSGPCPKRPGWDLQNLSNALVGRSHRSKPGKARLNESIVMTAEILNLPKDYRVGIVPGSDTGAFEMAMWTMLGQRGVDVFAWESFSSGWVTDITKQLKLKDVNVYTADYGKLPDLSKANFKNDVVFVWNGTTGGVKVPNGDWIDANRDGLTFCDATSAVFAMELPFEKLDVVTYSWQKVLGGEAAHGVLILSPRAVERLESYSPPYPLPKVFRLTKKGKLSEGIFKGSTINTPSMLCVEDYIDGLNWVKSLGGLSAILERSMKNFKCIENWVSKTDWIDFLADVPEHRSNTSVCLKVTAPWFLKKTDEEQSKIVKEVVSLIDAEGAAYDFGSYRDAPPGFRFWAGGTVEEDDLNLLFPWLEWGYQEIQKKYK